MLSCFCGVLREKSKWPGSITALTLLCLLTEQDGEASCLPTGPQHKHAGGRALERRLGSHISDVRARGTQRVRVLSYCLKYCHPRRAKRRHGTDKKHWDPHCLRGISSNMVGVGVLPEQRVGSLDVAMVLHNTHKKADLQKSLHTQEVHTALRQAVCPRPSISNLASFHLLPSSERGG